MSAGSLPSGSAPPTARARLPGPDAAERRRRLCLLVLVAVYVVLMVRAQHNKLHSFGMGFDLALYEQVIWNTSQGRPFVSSALGDTDVHLGRDVILVELLVALPYALVPSTYTLFVLQTLALAAGALAVYVLARKHLEGGGALLMAAVYLAYLPLQFLNLYEFQPRVFAMAPILLAFHFLEDRRLLPFVLSLLAVLCTRTDLALAVAMLGILALLERRPRPFAWWALGLGLAWFVLVVGWVVPHFNPQGQFLYFRWFNPGPDPDAGVQTPLGGVQPLLTAKTGRFLAAVYGPLAFLPLLRPHLLLVSLPAYAMGALSTMGTFLDIRYQYAAIVYPVAFAAAIDALRWASSLGHGLSARAVKRCLLAAVAVGTTLSYVLQLSPLLQWNRSAPPAGRSRSLARLLGRIPESASVAASSHVAPFVARREGLLHFPPLPFVRGFYVSDLDRADYVLALEDDHPDALAGLANNPGFVKEAERARAILYRRRTAEDGAP